MWYISMLIVAFFYIYLTAIQYIRGEELPARQSLHGKRTANKAGLLSTSFTELERQFGSEETTKKK